MKHEAAGTYVQISRPEFESWLKSTGFKWTRDMSKAGIYTVDLSPNVGILISSSIGSRDDAMGRGRAAMQMRLVSTVTGQTLNKKAQGKSHFKRTTNWKTTWKKGLDEFKSAYMKAKDFYDKIATIKDRDQYKEKWLRVIEAVDGWAANDFLKKQHDALTAGKIVSDKVEAALLRSKPSRATPVPGKVDEALVNLARQAWVAAKRAGQQRDLDFLTSLGKRFAQGTTERDLSPGQLKWWGDIKRRYRLRAASTVSTQRVASEYLTLNLVDAAGGDVEQRTLPASSLKYLNMFQDATIQDGPGTGMRLLDAVESGLFKQATSRVASRYLADK